MEWMDSLRQSIKYVEEHLYDDINAEDIADNVNMSSFYFQKGFKIITGYSIGEYIRCRRLYLAGLDVLRDDEKIIDLAYRYHYENPESFTKAFTRFHGVSPMQLRKDASKLKTFLPLRISISIQGGKEMDYIVEDIEEIKVIGFMKEIITETSYRDIPKAWNELSCMCEHTENKELTALLDSCFMGEYGICIEDDRHKDRFQYLMAGTYHGEKIPEEMIVYTIPAGTYVKFKCIGPLPEALQSVNTRIYKEWLPEHPEYVFHGVGNVEWYPKGDMQASDYACEIWMPVRRVK